MEDAQPDMKQRIAERRAALEAKLRVKRAGQTDVARQEESEGRLGGKGDEQIRQSRRRLNALKSAAQDAVTRFRIVTDADENERRIKEETLQAARDQKITDEKASSQRRHGSIQMKFDSLFQTEVPHDLAREIALQREECRKVIDVKDKVINEFRLQMREKEEEYVRALKQQSEDIDQLIGTMHKQTETVVKAYVDELQSIERAFEEERREQLAGNDKEIEALVNQRSTREREHNKRREARVWEDQKILDDKYEEHTERYNKCKMEHQHNIHGLAQELERMRALYMLNAERLSYNLQVLRERVRENGKAITQHKKKLSRLQDVLSSLIARYAETDKRFRQANNELTQSYRRVTEQYKDLQLKFQHFEKADADKFQQVWQMHEGDCMKLVHRCLQGDRVVFEELLGVPWVPPSLDFWLHTATEDAGRIEEEEAAKDADEQIELGDMAQAMLQILYSQVPFLLDDKVRQVLQSLGNPDGNEAQAIRVESILQSLGIKKTEDVNRMLEYFLTESDEGATALISPQEAVRALHRFLEDRRKEQASRLDATDGGSASATPVAGASASAAGKKDSKEATAAAAGASAKVREDRRKAEVEFWQRMANVVPEGHFRVWSALEAGVSKYLKQLQQRAALIEETDGIRKQNDELRALLNQYLGSRLNEELFSPPQLQVLGAPAS